MLFDTLEGRYYLSTGQGGLLYTLAGSALSATVPAGNDTVSLLELSSSSFQLNINTGSQNFINSFGALTGISIQAGSGNDSISAASLSNTSQELAIPVTIVGGAGSDSLQGGKGADSITAGSGGAVLDGAQGNDTLVGGSSSQNTVDYSRRNVSVTIDLNNTTQALNGQATPVYSGASGETDLLVNIQNAQGGAGNDSIVGNGSNNVLVGNAGNNTIGGAGGDDTISGSTQVGGNLSGGAGNDYLFSQNNASDTVNGGTGTNFAYSDPIDILSNIGSTSSTSQARNAFSNIHSPKFVADPTIPNTYAGQLDPSYFPDQTYSTNDSVRNIAGVFAIPGGKTIVVGTVVDINQITHIFVARYNSDGSLDQTFGYKGETVTLTSHIYTATAGGAAIDSQGRIVVGGTYNTTNTSTVAIVARFTADGALDTSFGGGKGFVQATQAALFMNYSAVAFDSAGNIIAAGNDGGNVFVDKYTPTGTVDTVGGSGRFDQLIYGTAGTVTAVEVDANNSIYVSMGDLQNFATRPEDAIIKLTPNLTLDTTFAAQGIYSTSNTGNYPILSLALDPNGNILAGGQDSVGAPYIIEISGDGLTTDRTLSSTVESYYSGASIVSLDRLPSGEVVAGMYAPRNGVGGTNVIQLIAPNGGIEAHQPVPAFNSSLKVTAVAGQFIALANIDSNTHAVDLYRFTANGSAPLAGFGTNGVAQFSPLPDGLDGTGFRSDGTTGKNITADSGDTGDAATYDGGGDLYVAGTTDGTIYVQRYLPGGGIDGGYGTNGILLINTDYPVTIHSMTYDNATGDVLVAGSETINGVSVPAIFATNYGGVDASFANNGQRVGFFNNGNNTDSSQYIQDIEVASYGGLDVLLNGSNNGVDNWSIAYIDSYQGALQSYFGASGIVNSPTNGQLAGNLAYMGSDVLVSAYAPGGAQAQVLAFNRATGAVDTGFGTNGVAENFSAEITQLSNARIAIDGNGAVLLVTQNGDPNSSATTYNGMLFSGSGTALQSTNLPLDSGFAGGPYTLAGVTTGAADSASQTSADADYNFDVVFSGPGTDAQSQRVADLPRVANFDFNFISGAYNDSITVSPLPTAYSGKMEDIASQGPNGSFAYVGTDVLGTIGQSQALIGAIVNDNQISGNFSYTSELMPTPPTVTGDVVLALGDGTSMQAVSDYGNGFSRVGVNHLAADGVSYEPPFMTQTFAGRVQITSIVQQSDGSFVVAGINGTHPIFLKYNKDGTLAPYAPWTTVYPTTFQAQSTYAAGDGTFTTAVGDVSGDGTPDMVVANGGNIGSISVMFGCGDGTFGTQQMLATPYNPEQVELMDVNGDGYQDIVVVNSGNTSAVSIFLNNGNGTFAAQFTTTGMPYAGAVSVADINGDGKPDLVLASQVGVGGTSNGQFAVLLNQGNGTFQSPILFSNPGPASSKTMAVGDFNSDGNQDIILSYSSNRFYFYQGNGDGTFAAGVTFSGFNFNSSPVTISAGDVNGDGRLDLVCTSFNSSTVAVLLGNGDGSFAAPITFQGGKLPYSNTLADLNGDGNLDIIENNFGYGYVSVFNGNGDGTFQTAQTFATDKYTRSITVADLNFDNRPDLLLPQYTSSNVPGSVDVLLNTSAVVNYSATQEIPGIVVAMAQQADGKIIALINGRNQAPGSAAWIERLNLDGSLDRTFGVDGVAYAQSTNAFFYVKAEALKIDASGNILITGEAIQAPGGSNAGPPPAPTGNSDFFAARFLPSGTLDASFGTQGVFEQYIGDQGANDTSASIAIDTHNRIYLGGSSVQNGNTEFTILQLTSAGVLNTTDGYGGVIFNQIDNSSTFSKITSLQVLNGDILLAGGYATSNSTSPQNALVLAEYVLDNNVPGISPGQLYTPFGGTPNAAVATGFTTGNGGNTGVNLDTPGVVTDYLDNPLSYYGTPTSGNFTSTDLSIQPDGNILLAAIGAITISQNQAVQSVATVERVLAATGENSSNQQATPTPTVQDVSTDTTPPVQTSTQQVNDAANNLQPGLGTALKTSIQDKVLTIPASPVGDDILVDYNSDIGMYEAFIGGISGSRQTFLPYAITAISVAGGNGNDTITIDPSVTIAVSVDGGNGNDSLTAGAGDDVLTGDNGNDTLVANVQGSGQLLGGNGDDTFVTNGTAGYTVDGGLDSNSTDVETAGNTYLNIQNNASPNIAVAHSSTAGNVSQVISTPVATQTFVVTNTHDTGTGSLRAAILNANALTSGQSAEIDFNINLHGGSSATIALLSALPALTNTTYVLGNTEGGYAGTPRIIVDGSAITASTTGIEFSAGNSAMYGITVQNFTGNGVMIDTAGSDTVSDNQFLANHGDGVYIKNTASNVISNNVIAANFASGVEIGNTDSSADLTPATAATSNSITSNIIGLDADGATGDGNGGDGISIDGAASTSITGNVIADNGGDGINIRNRDVVYVPTASNGETTYVGETLIGSAGSESIQNNIVGTDASSDLNLGNAGSGIFLSDLGNDNLQANVVDSNASDGILIEANAGNLDSLTGNFIGMSATPDWSTAGTLGNGANGISLLFSTQGVLIGGSQANANVIGGNAGAGALIGSGASEIQISQNAIDLNGGLGIASNGATVGAAVDSAEEGPASTGNGANDGVLQPTLTSDGTNLSVAVSGTANTTVTLEYFSIPAADATGYGEGRVYLGSQQVALGASGTATVAPSVYITAGTTVSATLTTAVEDTSNFSNSVVNPTTINATSPGQVQFSASGVQVNASAGTVTLTINRVGGSFGAGSVHVATSDGTAIAGTNYTAYSQDVNFVDGQTSAMVTIAISPEGYGDADKSFTVTLSSPVNVSAGNQQSESVTIHDDTAEPTVTVANSSVTNVTTGTTTLAFDVHLSAKSDVDTTLNVATANGTALAGTNYVALNTPITIKAGQTDVTVNVTVNGNAAYAASKTLFLNLSSASNATLTTIQATGTINNGAAAPALSIADNSVIDPSGGTSLVFTVTLTGATELSTTVNYSTANGTAIAGTDYTATSNQLTFAPGQTTQTQTITVPITGETFAAGATKAFTLALGSQTNSTISRSTATGTINYPAQPGQVQFSATAVQVNASAGTVTLTINRVGGSFGAGSVHVATSDGSAIAGTNYTAYSQDVNFIDGQTSAQVKIAISPEGYGDADKTFTVILTSPVNVGAGNLQVEAVTIHDDTAAPTLSVADNSVIDPSGGTSLVFTVTLTGASDVTTTVNFNTVNGTAIAGTDYTAVSNSLTFLSGQHTQTITVPITGETYASSTSKAFSLQLSGQTNATISRATATGTINYPATAPVTPSASIGDAQIVDVTNGKTTLQFTITLSSPATKASSVLVTASNITATSGVDFTFSPTTVKFGVGQQTATVNVTILGHAYYFPDRTFSMTLSQPVNVTISKGPATGTIHSGYAMPAVSALDTLFIDPESGVACELVAVTLSVPSSQTLTFTYATSGGTAVAGRDYLASTGKLTFLPFQTIAYVPISVYPSTAVQPTATFKLTVTPTQSQAVTLGHNVATVTIVNLDIGSVQIGIDPFNSNKNALYVYGTDRKDVLSILQATTNPPSNAPPGSQGIVVMLNGVSRGTYWINGHLFLYGNQSDDLITVDPAVTLPVFMYGNDGNDTLKAGGGPTIELGGNGADLLQGSAARSILIADAGQDSLLGGSGDTLLDGGATTYDGNAAALNALLNEWSRTDKTFSQRVTDITTGGGLNGNYKLNASTSFASAVIPDTLQGGTGNDLFFINTGNPAKYQDQLLNKKAGDVVIKT